MQGVSHEPRTAPLEPRERRDERWLADWNDARLVAFAMHAELLTVDIEVADFETHELFRSQAAPVGKLEHRAVTQAERTGAAGAIEQTSGVRRREHAREVIAPLGRPEPGGGALGDDAVLAQARVERPDGGDAARDRGRREAALREGREVATKIGKRDRLWCQVALACPGGQVDEIGLVGAAGALRQGAAREIADEHRDRTVPGVALLAAREGCGAACGAWRSRGRRRSTRVAAKVAAVGVFYIHVHEGHIATLDQLAEAEIIEVGEDPTFPWHRIDASSDATTMWYAAMRKRERDIFLGTLTFRHGDHHSLLLDAGWEEVPVEEIGPPGL